MAHIQKRKLGSSHTRYDVYSCRFAPSGIPRHTPDGYVPDMSGHGERWALPSD